MKFISKYVNPESIFFAFLFSGAIETVVNLNNLTFILFALSLITGLFRLIKERKIITKILLPIFLFTLFIVGAIISYSYTSSTSYGLDKLLRLLTLSSWSFIGVFILLKNKESLKKFIVGGLLITFVISTISLFNFYVGNYSISTLYNQQLRFGGANAIGLARLAGVGVILAISLMMYRESKNLMILVMTTIFVAVLFLTGSRMPLISLGIIIILIILLSLKLKSGVFYLNRKVLILIFLSLVGIVTVWINWNHPSVYIMRMRLEMLINSNGNLDASSSERLRRMESGFEMFNQNIFTGQGIGSFSTYYDSSDIKSYPHNIFIESLSEFGLISTLILFLLFFIPVVLGIREYYLNSLNFYQLTISMIFIYLLMNANVTGDINDNRALYAFVAMGYMLKSYRVNEDEWTSDEGKIHNKKRLKRYKLTW